MDKTVASVITPGADRREPDDKPREPVSRSHRASESGFSGPRHFLDRRFVYVVISQRARGLTIGVNMNPDKYCNFNCIYCEVDRVTPSVERKLNVRVMSSELQDLLALTFQRRLREFPVFQHMPDELLELKEVALSGNGEPTLCPNFSEVVREVIHVRSLGKYAFFKLVLVTNATGLDLPEVRQGLRAFTSQDEIWAKLEAGTQAYMDRINHGNVPLEKVLANIRLIASERPVIIQSLFPLVDGREPPEEEIEAYAQRLRELRLAGAQIPLVQVYSAHRPPHNGHCGHLPLKSLSRIAQCVRDVAGLKAEVF